MKVESRQDVKEGKIFVNIVLTMDELERLYEGKVLNDDTREVSIQIVGYGDE